MTICQMTICQMTISQMTISQMTICQMTKYTLSYLSIIMIFYKYGKKRKHFLVSFYISYNVFCLSANDPM
jgi:hypothetical protein